MEQPIRFPGQYVDEETGYHQNYYRDYAPDLGRYIQSDPIGLWGGVNTYVYVGNNPLIYIDPYGLAPTWVGPTGAVVGTTGGTILAAGLKTGNLPAIVTGAGLSVVGLGLTGWDLATTPTEQIDQIKNSEKIDQIDNSISDLKDLLDGKNKDAEQCK